LWYCDGGLFQSGSGLMMITNGGFRGKKRLVINGLVWVGVVDLSARSSLMIM
jgi:hypothetical protein